MSTTFLFIRHGETDLAGTFCGSSDPGLNERGREQVKVLAEGLEGERIDAIFSSELRRAKETAELLALGRGLGVQGRAGWREIDFGAWEGLRWKEIEAGDAAYAERWMKEFPALPAPGGEVFSEFRRRVLGEVEWLRGWVGRGRQQVPFGDDGLEGQGQNAEIPRSARNDLGGCVAVVTHGGVLGLLLEEYGGFTPYEAWERTRDYTCSIRMVEQSSGGALSVLR